MAMTVNHLDGIHLVFSLAEEARDLYDRAGDATGRAASRDFLASLYEYSGDLTTGLEYALDALDIARSLGDPVRQGYALSNVGGILASSGDLPQAIARLEEALALFENCGDVKGLAAIAARLSKITSGGGQLDEAARYANLCLEVGRATADTWVESTGLAAMAELAERQGNLDEAERLYRAALDLLVDQVAKNVLGGETFVALGRLLLRRGATSEAREILEEALTWFEDQPIFIMNELAIHDALSELHESEGRLSEALDQLKKAQLLRERIAKQEARNKSAQVEMRAAMAGAKKDAEIHRLKYVELHGMQAKLLEAEKMALLGKLAAGTAHELNTPLGVLKSNGQLADSIAERLACLPNASDADTSQREKLLHALRACRGTSETAMARISAVAESFKKFSQLDQADRREFDVHEGLKSALSLLEPGLPEGVRVERQFGPLPPVDGYPRELNHAFFTVLQNAAQAIEGPGTITVQTTLEDGMVVVKIRDTGRGMTPDETAQLFEVAWSDRGVRTKMRLGLSAARATVLRHGGDISVDSSLGRGTEVTFRVPGASGATVIER
jgi:signal transduction histidine kinase